MDGRGGGDWNGGNWDELHRWAFVRSSFTSSGWHCWTLSLTSNSKVTAIVEANPATVLQHRHANVFPSKLPHCVLFPPRSPFNRFNAIICPKTKGWFSSFESFSTVICGYCCYFMRPAIIKSLAFRAINNRPRRSCFDHRRMHPKRSVARICVPSTRYNSIFSWLMLN